MILSGLDLWPAVEARTRHASSTGSLYKLATRLHVIADEGVDFLVRLPLKASLKKDVEGKRKRLAQAEGRDYNPFLPYEQDLYVGDLSPTHLCLLNKYNVIDHHILIVTRSFSEQEAPLDRSDIAAAALVLAAKDGLLFYNAGREAGASQRHKHLQFLPVARAGKRACIPIEALLASAGGGGVPGMKFPHVFARFAPGADWQTEMFTYYQQGLDILNLSRGQITAPYNLLVTREWLLLVPRGLEKFHKIQVNSLGFSGSLLARNLEQLAFIEDVGPMAVLNGVAQQP